MEPEQASALLRDLSWAVRSPLLCGTLPPLFATWAARTEELVDRLASEATCLPEALWQKRGTPIGRYFESLIAFWLEQQSEVQGLVQNLPIFEGKRTVGELDLLFEAEGQAYHWELAVKLYLGTGECTTCSSWLGPLARDRLDRKLAKLYQRQLKLPGRKEAQLALRALGFDRVQSFALIKGYLFHPYERWRSATMQEPPQVSTEHARGWWLRHGQAHVLAKSGELCYQPLAKADWLGPASGSGAIEHKVILDWLADTFSRDPRAILLAAIDESGAEQHRGFVVADDWGTGAAV